MSWLAWQHVVIGPASWSSGPSLAWSKLRSHLDLRYLPLNGIEYTSSVHVPLSGSPFNGFAQIIGGVVAYGIPKGTDTDQDALAGWKIMFLWIGLVTLAFGVALFFFMPDNPLKARFLTQRERIFAIERIRINLQGLGNKHFRKYRFVEALKDPLVRF